ncbi:MAG: amidohydrolase family protein [Pseudomonadota bacterium]
MIPAIDSHIHIWDRTRGETFIAEKQFPQLTGLSFLPDQVPDMLASTGATSAVLVHGPSSLSHTAHCLKMAEAEPLFLSVIGWIDIRGGNWRAELSEFSASPLFRGIRLMPGLDPDPEGFLRSEGVRDAARALGETGQILEVLAGPALHAAVAAIARAAPQTTVSLAHFGLPTGDSGKLPMWREAVSDVAACSNVIVKASGLPLTGEEDHDSAMTRAHLSTLLDLFGSERICYSSNWPVATALAPPSHWRRTLDAALTALGTPDRDTRRIYQTNTEHHYTPRPSR